MTEFAKEVLPVNIEDELKHSYLDYAMSVIVSRALPDIRDGLKPVHRRVLYAMHVLNNDWNKAYKKSARIVGDVIGKYHPHGDVAVYHTIVRMAQSFSMRYMLVDGQGNFGSIDGDSPAAMRYTEVRMSRLAHFLLADLEKNTVDFAPNYDGTEMMPCVLPSQIPNLLVNGAAGIAVGMATNIPPHNLSEVVDACVALIKNPEIKLEELMQHIKGPDFPTAGIINGRAGIVRAYRTGRGRIYVRAKSHVEEKEKTDKKSIIVTELPYQVNKARLLEKIAELVKDKKIEGISALRDESDKDGMRMVIELRRGEIPDVVLNNLYAHTALQNVFGINIVALKEGQPQVFNLKQTLEAFVEHRRDVVTRRTVFELKKAQARSHLLEGLSIALENIDTVIALIKAAKTPAIAKQQLLAKTWVTGAIKILLEEKINEYKLSGLQAQAILDLRLHRLTGLEQEKIINEYKEILKSIADLKDILSKPERVMQIIHQELLEIKKQFGDARRTEIVETKQDLTTEDLITEEDVVVTLSHEGYVKTQSLDLYQAQHRGGRGKTATSVKASDFVEHLLIANTHDNILCFSNNGKVYWLKVYQIPQATRQSRGRPIINLLPLEKGERINAILPVKEYVEDKFIFMATENGTVKKTSLKHFSRPRANGIIALELASGDRLVGVDITNGKRDVMLFSDSGKAIRFAESAVRPMGRTARGVRGIKLKTEQKVISLVIVRDGGAILTATENGYGKRTNIEEYNRIGRGGQGVISIQVSDRNGKVVGATQVIDTDEIMLISNRGTLVRTRIDEISMIGRNTQGVRLISVAEEEKLIGIAKVAE
jgi:DNA gyrase subunit A